MMQTVISRILLLIMCLFWAACSGTRHLPPGEKLYGGAKVKLESEGRISSKVKRSAKKTIEDAIRPEPNRSFLGMRPGLWLYMAAGDTADSKFKKRLRKTGEAPVLISNVKPEVSSSVIDAKLFNTGFFNSSTEYKIISKDNKTEIIYISKIHEPYTVKELICSIQDDSLGKIISEDLENSLIKPGDDYRLDILRDERIRTDELLKNKGYFYFNPDYLLFEADTSNTNHEVALTLTLKENVPEKALKVYRIHNIDIDQSYSLMAAVSDSSLISPQPDGNMDAGNISGMEINPSVLLKSVYLEKDEVYSLRNHNVTLNRLMSLGVFKYVSIKYSESDTSAAGYLTATILLTPMTKHTMRAEMDIVSKSNDFIGPRANLSYLNKNTFKGAELLKINISGSYEAQLRTSGENLYSYSWNPQIELSLPRLWLPFSVDINSRYTPGTRFLLSLNNFKRVNYFNMRKLQFSYGLNWKGNILTDHELNIANISYTSISNRSDAFTELLDSNPFLKKSYEEQFIAGAGYSYTYNEQLTPGKKNQYYFKLTTETAGNSISLARLIGGAQISAESPGTLAGSVYSQYARLSIDGRIHYNFENDNMLALRLFSGVAVPYGNSSVLPYSKQFFSGGPNSIRAFHINSVGPGTVQQDVNDNGFLQMGGDIRLEGNAEYRYNIIGFLKGAVFADAGNVWLLKSNPSNTGSPFLLSEFYNELAVGAGLGLRLDISFVILRFDLAMPLRKPWLEENQRWVLKRVDFGDPQWRRENLLLNIAIGYPF